VIRFPPVNRERLGRPFPQGRGHVHKVWTNLWNKQRIGSSYAPAPRPRNSNEESGTNPVDNDLDLATAWQRVVEELQPNQQAWVQASEPVTLHGNTAIIAVADDFTRTQLEGRLRGQLEDALTAIYGHEIRLAVTVNAQLGDGARRPQPSESISPPIDMSTDGHIAPTAAASPGPSRATGRPA